MTTTYPTEQAALAAAVVAGWTIHRDQYGTTCTYHYLTNRLVDAGAQGWYWIIAK